MGICGSDISAYKGLNPLVEYPTVIGHEIAGEVVSVPDNNRGIKPGDKVILEPCKYYSECYPCRIGKTNCCENLKVIGVHVDGGMSEYYSHDLYLTYFNPSCLFRWLYSNKKLLEITLGLFFSILIYFLILA
jgi:threonine dehydrogenase-like Zn-dependent dehydrogenase